MPDAPDMLDRLATILREAVAQRRRARLRLAHPDPEIEAERQFLDDLADALMSPGGVDVIVCRYVTPGRVGLVRPPARPLTATRSTLVFESESARDAFYDQVGLIPISAGDDRQTVRLVC